MKTLSPARALLLLLAAAGLTATAAPGQAAPLRPSATSSPAVSGVPAARAEAAQTRRVLVQLDSGRLTVAADNSSLNQILREISRATGIRIIGGVVDERVFGTYGPDTPARILAALLDGTSSNMLFVAGNAAGAGELVLTPRTGGPTPPNPNAAIDHDAEETTDRPPNAQQGFPSGPPQRQPGPGPSNAGAPSTAAPASSDGSTPTAPPADSTTVQSPNGVRTPQQIYDQLIQLQKQQQTATPP